MKCHLFQSLLRLPLWKAGLSQIRPSKLLSYLSMWDCFHRRSIYFQVTMRRNSTQELAYFKFLNFQVRCWLHETEEPFIPSTIVFAEWNIQNWDVRRRWDLPVRRGPHCNVHTRAEVERVLGDPVVGKGMKLKSKVQAENSCGKGKL